VFKVGFDLSQYAKKLMTKMSAMDDLDSKIIGTVQVFKKKICEMHLMIIAF
jgi:hypothetical protein